MNKLILKKEEYWSRLPFPTQGILMGYSPLSQKESDATENAHTNKLINKYLFGTMYSSVQFSPVMFDSLQPHGLQYAGFPVHHQLPEFTQTHVPFVGHAIQPSHPLSSPFPPTFNHYQHQGLFKWVSSSHQVAKVLEFQLQHQSFQWIFRTYCL